MQFEGSLLVSTISSGTSSPASISFDYTEAADSLVFVFTRAFASSEYVTAVTFNGQAMTQVARNIHNVDDELILWKYRPSDTLATGTYTISITGSGATFPSSISVRVAQYSGAKDDVTSYSFYDAAYSASPTTFSLTTVADNSWLIAFMALTSIRTFTGSTDGTFRNPTSNFMAVCDSGASEGAAGSKSINMTVSSTPSGNIAGYIFELKRETAYEISVSETVSSTEAIARAPTRTVNETVSHTDSVARTLARTLSEALALVESFAYETSRIFSESTTLTDALSRAITRVASEVVSFVESKRIAITRTFSESLSLQDVSPQVFGVWLDRAKPNTSWSDHSSPSTVFSGRTPPASSFSGRTPPSDVWTNRTPPNTTWS